jgi:hypothetical protein
MAILLQGLAATAIALSGTYGQLLDFVIFAALVFYMLTAAGLFLMACPFCGKKPHVKKVASKVLMELGVDPPQVVRAVERTVGRGERPRHLDHRVQRSGRLMGRCYPADASLLGAPTAGARTPPAARRKDSTAAGIEPLSWEMLAHMVRAGVIVGSHTRSHAWLTQESPIDVLDEARGSREEIARRLGITVEHFAYPDGRFDAATVRAVAAAGYRFAYTTCTHRDPRHPLLTLPRRMLWENACVDAVSRFSPAIMSCQVHGVWSLMGGCGQDHHRA